MRRIARPELSARVLVACMRPHINTCSDAIFARFCASGPRIFGGSGSIEELEWQLPPLPGNLTQERSCALDLKAPFLWRSRVRQCGAEGLLFLLLCA